MNPEDVPHDKFIAWAKRHGLDVAQEAGEERNNRVPETSIAVTEGGYVEIMLTKYGNIHMVRHKHLGGEAGEISIGNKQITVVNERGQEHRVTPWSYPI